MAEGYQLNDYDISETGPLTAPSDGDELWMNFAGDHGQHRVELNVSNATAPADYQIQVKDASSEKWLPTNHEFTQVTSVDETFVHAAPQVRLVVTTAAGAGDTADILFTRTER